MSEATYDNSTAGRCPMTPQPKQHCDHEGVCDDFHPEYDPDYQEVCNNQDCPHDTRSRPHPAHPTEAQQRIDAPLMRKEIVRIMIAGRHNNDRTYREIADEIIALLQAGDQHE